MARVPGRADRGDAAGREPRIPPIVVAGVSGAGKTTVGELLAARLGVPFLDADDLHDEASVAKLHAGVPLDDTDRAPWLDRVGDAIAAAGPSVIACSALKRAYRDRLRVHAPELFVAQLRVPVASLRERLARRRGHFAAPSLLDSQLADLEPLDAGERGAIIDAVDGPDRAVEAILARLPG